MESLRFYAMGTDIEVLLDAEEDVAWTSFAQVPLWFEAWEQHLSRFRAESELGILNSRQTQLIRVSADFADVLNLALHVEERSHGLITPAILPALMNAGYDRSFEMLSGDNNFTNQFDIQYPVSTKGLDWNQETRELKLPAGMQLDFGGVAKGWAAHQAAQRLSVLGPVLVNAGGDIATAGYPRTQDSWHIGIRHPYDRDNDFATLQVHGGGIATSAIDHRHWQKNGTFRHHLIDPNTGLPSTSDLLQVTVLANDVMQAEMAAKIVFLKSSHKGLNWLKKHPQYKAILIDRQGNIQQTNNVSVEMLKELQI